MIVVHGDMGVILRIRLWDAARAALGLQRIVGRGAARSGGSVIFAKQAGEEGGERLLDHGEAAANCASVGFHDAPDCGRDVAPYARRECLGWGL